MDHLRNLLSLAIALLLSGCCCHKPDPKEVVLSDKTQIKEYRCEAHCTYKSTSGAVRRIYLQSSDVDLTRAWEKLTNACVEIQSVTSPKVTTATMEPLLTSITTKAGDYEMRKSSSAEDCRMMNVEFLTK